MIDTHCHVNIEEFEKDSDQVIKDAIASGVKKMIVIGIDQKSNLKAIAIAEQYEEVYVAVGIHPSVCEEENFDDLIKLISHPKVVAIGECGIDLYWQQDNLEKQKEVFIKQIELSILHKLPLIIHTRNSFKEAYDCVIPYKNKARGVFHCFSSNLEDAFKAIGLGFYVGIDGPVTFKNAKDIKEIAKEIPLDRILIETDSPYLSPHPLRGKRNEPKNLRYIALALSEIKSCDIKEVIQETTSNAINLFKLGE